MNEHHRYISDKDDFGSTSTQIITIETIKLVALLIFGD